MGLIVMGKTGPRCIRLRLLSSGNIRERIRYNNNGHRLSKTLQKFESSIHKSCSKRSA